MRCESKNKYHGMKDYYGGSQPLSSSIPDKKSTGVGTDALYLQDLSKRDKPWDKHRENSDRVADYYREAKKFEQYATRIDFCSQLLDFKLVLEEKELKLKLDSARFLQSKALSSMSVAQESYVESEGL